MSLSVVEGYSYFWWGNALTNVRQSTCVSGHHGNIYCHDIYLKFMTTTHTGHSPGIWFLKQGLVLTLNMTSHTTGVRTTPRRQPEECCNSSKECACWEDRQSSICYAWEKTVLFLKGIILLENDPKIHNAIIESGFKGPGHADRVSIEKHLPKIYTAIHQCCWQLEEITHRTCS